MVPVIEVHRRPDGTWEALVRHVLSSNDLDTIDDLDRFPTERGSVALGGQTKELTIYLEDLESGWVRWDEAYPNPSS